MLHITERNLDGEFQEADILWPDDDAAQGLQQLRSEVLHYAQADPNDDDEFSSDHYRPTKLQIGQRASSPIDIPRRKGAQAQPAAGLSSKLGGSVVIGSHVFVPPHVIIDRRAKRDMAALMMFVVPSGGRARKIREHQYCYY